MTKTMTQAKRIACLFRKVLSGSLFLLLFTLVLDTWPGKTEAALSPRTYAEATKSMVETSKQYLGRPYKFRNPQGNIMDCSGFVQYIYALHGISIPRTASTQYGASRRITLPEAQPGDLMFFKGTNLSSSAIGHVAMVVENNGDGLKMIHSSSRGVVIDDYYKSSHYVRRFLYVGRIPQLEAKYPQTVAPTRNITIIGVGDIMLGTNYPSVNHLPPNDGRDLLNPVKDILSSADLTFANLEGVILSGAGVPKKCSNPSTCFAFKSPDHYGAYLRDAGIDLVSLANNHVGDFGAPGKSNTVRVLEELGIKYAGLAEYPSVVFTKGDVRYGFCAFAPNNGTMQINDYKEAARIVKELKSKSDIVIVSFHGGAEGSDKTRVTRKTEHFLGENRGNPYEFARMVIDAGADIVFGHGPHVTRAIDIYKGRFIAYSLGNFCTYGRFNLSGNLGFAPIIKVTVNGQGEFVDAEITSVRQPGKGGPIIDDGHSALKEIIKLTNLDFPETELVLGQDGKVTRKGSATAVSQR